MILRRVGPFSAAKISLALHTAFGFIMGLFFSFTSLVVGTLGDGSDAAFGSFGVIFGVAAVIVLPLVYGAIGFVAGALTAWIYNMIAKTLGGLEIDLEVEPPAPGSSNQEYVG